MSIEPGADGTGPEGTGPEGNAGTAHGACCAQPSAAASGSAADPAVGPSPGYHDGKAAYLRRLRLIEGQVRGLQRMVEEDAYCIDVLTQVSATTRALQSVATGLVDDHIHHCVHAAAASGDPAELERKMDEIMAAVKRLLR